MADSWHADTYGGIARAIPLILALVGLGILNAVVLLSSPLESLLEVVAPSVGLAIAFFGLILLSWKLHETAQLLAEARVLTQKVASLESKTHALMRDVDADRERWAEDDEHIEFVATLRKDLAASIAFILSESDRILGRLISAGLSSAAADLSRAKRSLESTVSDDGREHER